MPVSSTERFGRTYTPRVPDDSYDSLGSSAQDQIVQAPTETPYEIMMLTSSLGMGSSLFEVIVQAGQKAMVSLLTSLSGGELTTTAIEAPMQHDTVGLTATMAGGTLT